MLVCLVLFVCRGGFVGFFSFFFKLTLGKVVRAPTPSWGPKVGQAKPPTGKTETADRKDRKSETADSKDKSKADP